MKAVVMAGGLGLRLRPLTSIIPKPLLPLGDRNVVEVGLMNLAKAGVTEVIMCINYMSEYFESHFEEKPPENLKISFSKESSQLGTAGPLALIKERLSEPFIVVNGDILTNLNFSKFYKTFKDRKFDMLVGTKIIDLPMSYGVVDSNGDSIISVKEKPCIQTEVVAGIYCLSPHILNWIPDGQSFQMTDLLQLVLKRGKLGRFLIEDYWLDIGHMENYEKAKQDAQELPFLQKVTAAI